MSKVEQTEPKREEEVPADNGKPEVREEEASRSVWVDCYIFSARSLVPRLSLLRRGRAWYTCTSYHVRDVKGSRKVDTT